MNELICTMFENIIVYVWRNNEDMDDNGALLISSKDIDKAKEFSEYVSCRDMATSFEDFRDKLIDAEIDFYDISDNFDVFEYG